MIKYLKRRVVAREVIIFIMQVIKLKTELPCQI